MPDWQLWSLESLFNRRKSAAREMAKQTSFSSPISAREEGSTVGYPAPLDSPPKTPRAGTHQLSWASGREVTRGTHKTGPGTQSPGESRSPFGESLSLLLSLKSWLFLKTKIIRENWTFSHVVIWLLVSVDIFIDKHYQDQCQHDHLDFSFFQILCFWQERMLINMSVISLIRTLIKNIVRKIFSYKTQKRKTGQFSTLQNGNNFEIFLGFFCFTFQPGLWSSKSNLHRLLKKEKKKITNPLKMKSWPHWSHLQSSSRIQPS